MKRFGLLLVWILIILMVAGCSQASVNDPVSAYMVVIDRLMEHAQNLGPGIEYLAIDTTQLIHMNETEKAALQDRMKMYQLTVLERTRAELESDGLIRDLYFEKGLLIEMDSMKFEKDILTMDAQIWRGGAAGFGMNGL